MPDPDDFDSQDLAEVFDEENITEDGRDIANSDLEPDLFDVTSVEEDALEALEPDDDFDPDEADEFELEEIVDIDEDPDQSSVIGPYGANLVSTEDLRPADLESEDPYARSGEEERADGADADERPNSELDRRLDHGLEETFPASDPVAVSPRRH
jgi:hypothetical protein